MNNECLIFWNTFLEETNRDRTLQPYEVFHFSDSHEAADALAEATIAGKKTGTASLLWDYHDTGERIPRVGDLSLVTYANEKPACIIETTAVEITPFCEVSEAFARAEGDEDPSLAAWRACHWGEFSALCRKIGREPDKDMPVVCERIVTIHSPVSDRKRASFRKP